MALHDLNAMSEERKKLEYLARLETNLVFVVADLLETLWVECEDVNYRCGYQMRQEEKMHYKAVKHHLRAFRGATRHLDAKDQEEFGNDAELTLDLLYAAVTRTGTDNQLMLRFLQYIMSFPDRVGLDAVRKGGDAFEAIKRALAEGRVNAYVERDNNKASDAKDNVQ